MIPTSDAQLLFLSKLQRMFNEGDFTATYKYALLIALCDLAVEVGKDDDGTLELSFAQIASKFVELYWQQATPYSSGRPNSASGILLQNKGAQAAVINAVVDFRRANPATTLFTARMTGASYRKLTAKVAQTVKDQPINFLQNMGGQTDPFLFEKARLGVELKPGVMYSLRRFQPLVQQLARSHWVGHIKQNRLNMPMIGEADDLEAFLFETPRQSLQVIGSHLKRLTNCQCFYCGATVREADVDHFIPFAMYPRDLMHNFVLAHPACNRSKSDTLAAKAHLERWLEFITKNDDTLKEIGMESGCVADQNSSLAVARWGYSNSFTSGGQAWSKASEYQPVNRDYLELLA